MRLLLVEATRGRLNNEIHHRFSYRLLASMLACMLSLPYCMTWLFPFLLFVACQSRTKINMCFPVRALSRFQRVSGEARKFGTLWVVLSWFWGPLSYQVTIADMQYLRSSYVSLADLYRICILEPWTQLPQPGSPSQGGGRRIFRKISGTLGPALCVPYCP